MKLEHLIFHDVSWCDFLNVFFLPENFGQVASTLSVKFRLIIATYALELL